MSNLDKRNSGIDVLGEVSWGSHICQFYETKKDLLDILIPYFKAGLENNEYCLWVISDPLNLKEAKEEIIKRDILFKKSLEIGQMEIIPFDQWYLKNGRFDSKKSLERATKKIKGCLKNGYDGLRGSGNISWLQENDWEKFMDYEEEINKIVGDSKIIGLCCYRLFDKCSENKVFDVICNHDKGIFKKKGDWIVVQGKELKKTQESEEKYKTKFHKLFDSMTDGVSIIQLLCNDKGDTIDYIFLDVNKAYENIVGEGATELSSKAFRLDVLNEVNSNGEPQCYEFYDDFLKQYFQVSSFYMEKNKIGTIFSDITKRKKIEQTLRENEVKERIRASELQTIIEAVPAAVWIAHDPECKLITGNRTSYELLRLQPGLNVSKSATKDETPNTFFLSQDKHKMSPKEMPMQRASRGEIVKNTYFDVVFEDGTQIHLHGNAVPLFDQKGNSRGSVGVFLDITKRKKIEDKLKEAIEKTRLLINHAPTAIYEIDLRTGKFTQVNDVMCKILGYNREELMLISPFDILTPESVEIFKERIKKQLVGEKINDVIEYKVLTKDNRELCVVLNSSFIYEDGKPIATFVIAHDITERKKNQEKIKHLASFPYFNPRPIVELDMNGKIVYSNPCVLNLFPDIEKKSLKHPLLYGIDLDEIKKVGFLNKEVNVDFKWYQQEIIYISEMNTVRVYSSDITKRKEAEKKLHNFLSILGYELRNPLSSILLLTDLLEKQKFDNSDFKKNITQLKIQSKNMSNLLSDLLDISQIELGKLKIRKKRVNIIPIIRKIIEITKPILDKANQNLENIVPDESIFVMIDQKKIEKVIFNLINSACRLSSKNSCIKLIIEKNEEKVFIKIKNFGIGFPSNSISKIFNLFSQDDSFALVKNEGLGVELYLSKQLVYLYGGDINIYHDSSSGSEFVISFPLVKIFQNNVSQKKNKKKKSAKPKVMVVDDDIDLAETITQVLSTFGTEVKCVTESLKALKTIREFKPDIIFIDLVMSGIDGFTLAKKIRDDKNYSKVFLVAITGYGEEIDNKSVREAGFNEYLVKPISMSNLSKILKKIKN